MNRSLTLCAGLVVFAPLPLTSGCSSLIHETFDRPIIESNIEDDDRRQVLALKADRRLVFFMEREDAEGKPLSSYIIAEPSPDAFAEFAAAFQAAGEAAGNIEPGTNGATFGKIEGQAAAEIFDRVATHMVRLGIRSQGVIIFRDGTYRLAEAYMNEQIQPEQYAELYLETLSICAKLTQYELEVNNDLASDLEQTDDTDWRALVLEAARLRIQGDGGDDADDEDDAADDDADQDDLDIDIEEIVGEGE